MLKHRSDFRSLALHYKFWISFCFSHTFKTHAIIYFHYFIATIKIVEDLPSLSSCTSKFPYLGRSSTQCYGRFCGEFVAQLFFLANMRVTFASHAIITRLFPKN